MVTFEQEIGKPKIRFKYYIRMSSLQAVHDIIHAQVK